MGTRVVLTTYEADRARGLARLDGFLRVIEETDRELSTWKPDSQFSRLNRQPVGVPFGLDDRLCALFRTLHTWQRETSGAFDPAIGALVGAWGLRRGGAVPAAQELARSREVSGFDLLALDARRCTITRTTDVTVDAGAFGKGEALDRIRRVARDSDGPWMVDFGGQVAASGGPPGRDSWVVDVAHPADRAAAVFDLAVSSGSLAVTGGSERDLDVGRTRVGHVLDPRSGAPAVAGGAVLVWHPEALVADILSTALFVMGPSTGIAWADARNVAACYLTPGVEGRAVRGARSSSAFVAKFGAVCGAGR